MTVRRRWVIAVALLLTAPALAGCIGSDASSGEVDAPGADEGTDSATEGDTNGDDGADAESDAAHEGKEAPDADDPAGDEPTPSAAPSSLSFTSCDIQVGVFEVPPALVADEVPPGFEPTSVVEPGAPTASFVVDAHACRSATSDGFDASVEDVGWVSYLLAVDPPDEYEAEDVDFYFLPVASVADAPEVVDVYEAWNFPFEEGTVDLSATSTPAARTGQLEVRSENVSSTLHTAVSPDPAEGDPSHKGRWFQVSDGEVTSIVEPDVSASSSSLGGAERVVEPGSSDPSELPFWAAGNVLSTGVGQHFVAERIDFQPLDPATVAE